MTFHERKAARTAHYDRYVKGWKQRPCTDCNGSGKYDHIGSPACSACDGTGKERFRPEDCSCHLGSVCTDACKQGHHHGGCAWEDRR